MQKISIPKAVYVLCVAFAYGLLAYFWPDVPFDQGTFSLVVIAILGAAGVEGASQVKAIEAKLIERGLLK